MLKNEEYTMEVIDIDNNGRGIAKYDGIAVFIPNTVTGDIGTVKIIKMAKNYAVGKFLQFITPSPYRQVSKCQYINCGGCTMQNVSYQFQLEYKQKQVKDCLERIGKIKYVQVSPTIGMANPLNYRNKAQYPIRKIDNEIQIGFYAQRSHQIINIDECISQNIQNTQIIKVVKSFLQDNKISIYNEHIHKGLVRHLVIRTSFYFNEIMVCLVINGNKLPCADRLIDSLKQINGVTSILLNHNKIKGNVILSDQITALYGNDYITDKIGDLTFKISLLSFFQVNPIQTKILYEKALEFASLNKEETVLDAYCGIGTISLFLAEQAKKVVGVEIVPQAILNAKENAQINNIKNVEFLLGKSEDIVLEEKFDAIFLDPPRKGCDINFLETIVKNLPQKIVYISCDPATLARDLQFIVNNGYTLQKVQPVDMFPYTSHVEVIVMLTKN